MFHQHPQDITPRITEVEALRWFARGRTLVRDCSSDATTTLFGLIPGEIARVEIAPEGRLRDARIIEVLQPAADRVTPRCKQFDECSGCSLLHVSNEEQARYLRLNIVEVLQRYANIDWTTEEIEIVQAPAGDHRHRTRLIAGPSPHHKVTLGLRARQRGVATLSQCPANHPALRRATEAIESALRENAEARTSATRERTPLLAFLSAGGSIELSIKLNDDIAQLINATGSPNPSALLVQAIPPKPQRNAYPDATLHELAAFAAALVRKAVTEEGSEIRSVSAQHQTSWVEANPRARRALFAWLEDALSKDCTHLIDPTCAAGGLSLALALRRRGMLQVSASDRNWSAVQSAAQHAQGLGLATTLNGKLLDKTASTAVVDYALRGGDAQTVLQNRLQEGDSYHAALINPMREPLGDAAMTTLSSLVTRQIIYLAPAPQAGARDLAILCAARWKLERLAAIETHPWTARPMLAAVMTRG